jgi:VWFA-related protein
VCRRSPSGATVSDGAGRFATNLTREDLRILDNGRPVEISIFSSEVQPITVAVMLDMSGSMASRFLRVRASTLHFIDALLPHDRATIGTFGSEVFVSPLLTGDKAVLKRVVEEELWPGGGTPLWAAVDEAMTALSNETGRRIVLTLTDGRDSGGQLRRPVRANERMEMTKWPGDPNFGKVRKRAVERAFMVYAIGMEGRGLDSGIVGLADETGGGHFQLQRGADLTATFTRVADELRRQYLLGFVPATLDNKLQARRQVTGRGHTVRARKNYSRSGTDDAGRPGRHLHGAGGRARSGAAGAAAARDGSFRCHVDDRRARSAFDARRLRGAIGQRRAIRGDPGRAKQADRGGGVRRQRERLHSSRHARRSRRVPRRRHRRTRPMHRRGGPAPVPRHDSIGLQVHPQGFGDGIEPGA